MKKKIKRIRVSNNKSQINEAIIRNKILHDYGESNKDINRQIVKRNKTKHD